MLPVPEETTSERTPGSTSVAVDHDYIENEASLTLVRAVRYVLKRKLIWLTRILLGKVAWIARARRADAGFPCKIF